jgi:hypothetical protein
LAPLTFFFFLSFSREEKQKTKLSFHIPAHSSLSFLLTTGGIPYRVQLGDIDAAPDMTTASAVPSIEGFAASIPA